MRQRDVAALDAKYTKELADAKAENDALRDDAAAGRRRLHIKAVCQSVREATTASGVDNAASPRLAECRLDYFTFRERLRSRYVPNGRTQASINEDRVAHIDGQLIIIVSNTHALPAEYKCFS